MTKRRFPPPRVAFAQGVVRVVELTTVAEDARVLREPLADAGQDLEVHAHCDQALNVRVRKYHHSLELLRVHDMWTHVLLDVLAHRSQANYPLVDNPCPLQRVLSKARVD
jgi:hypothetical protein